MCNSEETLQRWNNFNIAKLLLGLGEDLDREGLIETPERVEKAWEELLGGYAVNPHQLLEKQFAAEGTGMQVCRNIDFTSMCEHHLLPFSGFVHIGYVPSKYVVGLSKLARLVDAYAKRLQIQERLAEQIANALYDEETIDACGVIVVVEAKHFCCCGRGVKRSHMDFVTSSVQGTIDVNYFNLLLRTRS
jgi:GTP cyclohydrolase I